MVTWYFLKGVMLGFLMAAPVGPIAILCMRRSLAQGTFVGLCSGLGAATADGLYGAVAAFGLTLISTFLLKQQFWLGLLGGGFLCYLGWHAFRSLPQSHEAPSQTTSSWGAFSSTLLLTLVNPMTIITFVAVFAGLGLGASPSYATASLLVLGLFVGSAAWWIVLSTGVGFLRKRVTPAWLRVINQFSGGLLMAFGLLAIVRACNL